VSDLLTRVARLRALLAAATPGRWEADGWAGGITGNGAARRIGLQFASEKTQFAGDLPGADAFVTVPFSTVGYPESPDSSLLLAMTMDGRAAEDARLIAALQANAATLLDATETLARLEALNNTPSPRWMQGSTLGDFTTLHDALEKVREDMARERGGKERG
jgi:hypothetical protein